MTVQNNLLPRTAIPEEDWHAMESNGVVHRFATSFDNGLTSEEAQHRLETYGANQLIEAEGVTIWRMLWEQINNFIVWLLIIASVVSAILGDVEEGMVILAIVILNAILGVFQERRAEQALAVLKRMAAPEAQVIRDGHRQNVPARELVPGDIVLLETGNYIPADIRLLEAYNLRIEEAALTGESLAVEKDASVRLEADIPLGDRKNTAFMGTVISYGRGRGVVVGTGMRTQIGLIAEMLQSVEHEPTPLQRRLDQLGKTLGYLALVVCALVFLVGWMRGSDPLDMFILAVSLAIAAVPEGLPAVVTISLALGMREMIKRNALIRRLSSVETLGSTTVICSDKTGTLTQNQMTVTRVWAGGKSLVVTGKGRVLQGDFLDDGKVVEVSKYPAICSALWVGALNNDAELEISGETEGEQTYRMVGDPTEGALVVAAAKAGALPRPLNHAYPRVQEIPFDSERKRMVTIHHVRDARPEDISPFTEKSSIGKHVVTVKGAADLVLELCSEYLKLDDQPAILDERQRQHILQANDLMTQDALRVLGVAYKVLDEPLERAETEKVEEDLIFVGLIGMIDPPRQEVPPALRLAAGAGIRTIMITGDYPNTARAIAETIGLIRPGHQVLTGSDINKMSQEQLIGQVEYTDVFARVSPEHKLRIVEALRERDEVVAMTGDGVNDAPSIKRADIGVAMGITGTDVAKESADMVLTDDNYASIVAAVEQGRVIYSNIRKFVYYLLACNVAEILIIFLGVLFDLGRVLTAIQLLLLNLVTDGLPALALGTEKGDPQIMKQKPRPPKESIINRFMKIGIGVQTLADTATTLTAYLLGIHLHPEEPHFANTMAFATLSLSELLRAYTARSERLSVFKIGFFTNRNMNIAVLISMVIIFAVIYTPFLNNVFETTPLGWRQWEVMLPLLIIPSATAEITKFVAARLSAKGK